MVSGLGNVYVNGQLISTNRGEQKLWIESKDLEFGTRWQKYIDTLVVELKNAGVTGATLKIGYRDRLEEPLQWTEPFSFGDEDPMHWTRITARYFRVRIDDDSPQTIWKLSALELFGQQSGGRL